MKKIIFVISILFLVSIAQADNYTVKRVISCNTIELNSGEEIQLIGIQCPEDEKMGQEATEFVSRLLDKGQSIRLGFDEPKKNKNGKLLVYAYSLICHNNCKYNPVIKWGEYSNFGDSIYMFINASIIKSGYASVATISPNLKHAELFQELFQEAFENNRGLWAKGWKFGIEKTAGPHLKQSNVAPDEGKVVSTVKSFDDYVKIRYMPSRVDSRKSEPITELKSDSHTTIVIKDGKVMNTNDSIKQIYERAKRLKDKGLTSNQRYFHVSVKRIEVSYMGNIILLEYADSSGSEQYNEYENEWLELYAFVYQYLTKDISL